MIKGFDSFRKWFEGYSECYTIIGGTACDLIMTDYDMDFRATRDIDLVLILEALTPEFGRIFWDYVIEAGYEHRCKGAKEVQFYRFSKPKNSGYPAMIELFSKKTDKVILPEDAILTPIPIDEEVSSLSAIILDENYYQFLIRGQIVLDGITILDTPFLIPFKMKAWLDLSERKSHGEQVDRHNISKHKNDVLKLSTLLDAEMKIATEGSIRMDIRHFLLEMENEDTNLRQLGIRGSKEEILERLHKCYLDE